MPASNTIEDAPAQSESPENGTLHQNTLAVVSELYDAIPASVIIVDARMRLIGWNRFSRETINGLNEDEMAGVNPLKRVHPDDLPEVSRKVREIINLDTEQSAEFRMYHKGGPPYKWATFRGKRAIIANQPCVVAVVTEITEVKEAEEERKKLQEQLLQFQKMELVGQLAGGIAHDFNNALAAIIGNAELALKKLDAANPAVSHLSDIHKLAHRSAEMTRKLLAFARKQSATPQVFELNGAVSECLRLHRSLIGESIRLELNLHDEPVLVKLDPVQLDQILSNMLINARDAITGLGCIQIACQTVRLSKADCTISHEEFAPGAYAKLTVSDNGKGIDATSLPHIFEPFFTTKETGKGTGLGLSTVYGIVMQNKGRIECKSEPGKGTSFTIYLPVHPGNGVAEKSGSAMELSIPDAREAIMVVDDEPAILDMIPDILENCDFTILTAKDATECLQIADKAAAPLALAVLDAVLPDMSCMELGRLLSQRNPSMKLLFMSAHAPEEVVRNWGDGNAVNFIQKPFRISDFMKMVEGVLNNEIKQI